MTLVARVKKFTSKVLEMKGKVLEADEPFLAGNKSPKALKIHPNINKLLNRTTLL